MAGEYRRARARKKIRFPSGQEMYIPTLISVSFVDPRDRYQEWQYSIDNTAQADRTTHVDDIFPTVVDSDGVPTSVPPSQNTSGTPLKAERVETWRILDPRSRYQESHVEFDNITGADAAPPHFRTHQKTHIYRYYKDPANPSDDGVWADSELIDELAHVDPRSRYQEIVATLNNPTNAEFRDGDLSGQASEDDPDITIGDAEGITDNPIRIDPFQNIVNFHDAESISIIWKFALTVNQYSLAPQTMGPTDFSVPEGAIILNGYDTDWAFDMTNYPPPDGVTITGAPTLDPLTFNFDTPWTYGGTRVGEITYSTDHVHASINMKSAEINSSGVGFYGSGPTGLHGGGWWTDSPTVDVTQVLSLDATVAGIQVAGVDWVPNFIGIANLDHGPGSSDRQIQVTVSFVPP